MLLDYYNLQEQPFGVTPDPRYLYLSASHREALASLTCGIRGGRGFMSLIAKPGMGKTTTLFQLLSQLKVSAKTAFLFQTLCGPEELLRALLHDLGVVRVGTGMARMQEQLNRLLVTEAREGRKVVVVIDEAQNLDNSVLELLRMLSNFETASDKMMQIVLAGQPQLREKLASPQLLQLRQRMSVLARLDPFDVGETRSYIEHRLCVASYNARVPLFTSQAEALIATHSGGIPRNINNICFNALSLGWVAKQRTISKEVITEVLRDLELLTETAAEFQRKPAARAFAWSAIRSSPVVRQGFAWRKRLAVFSMLLLPLVLLSGRSRNLKVGPPIPTSTIGMTPQPPAAPAASAESREAPKHPSPSSRKIQSHAEVPLPDDVSTLWQLVKKNHSDAEVKLANLYLEGTVVARNCTQAQILLQDASRKGNTRATDLLTSPQAQCHPSQ